MTTEQWAGSSPAIAGSLRRVWRCAGVPAAGTSGTYAGHADPGDLIIDVTNKTLYQNTNTLASPTWTQITAGGVTLDGAYDYGGAGVGRAIVANDGAVTISNTDADTTNVLEISKSPSAGAAGAGILVTMGANATGAGISFANTGGGADISGTGALWTVSKAGVAVFVSLSSGAVTLTEGTAPAGTVCYVVRDNTGDTTVNALTGKTIHLAVAGTDVCDIAGAGLTVTGTLTVTSTGSILALTLGEGTAPAATACYIVRDNTGDTTINAITGKSVHLAVAGTDVLDVAGAGVTVTGTLHVTGVTTFDAGWTFAGTITADAGIDLNGSYIILDADGNSRIDATSGDVMDLELAGNSEYTFTTTAIDLNANALDNAGFLILNAATAPAATEVYLVNDNTGDLTLNAVTGKTVNVAIAGTDVVRVSATALTFVASVNIAGFATGAITVNSGAADVDVSIAGDNNTSMLAIDAGTDSMALGRAVIAGAFLSIDGVTVNRAGVTSVGRGIHIPAGTYTQTNADPTTLAIGAAVYFGTPTFAGASANQTLSAASNVYIQGPATQGANMTASTVYSLWIETGTLRLDGDLTFADNAYDILVKADTAAALEISDGTTKLLTFDSRSTVSKNQFDFVVVAPTIVAAAGIGHTAVKIGGYLITLTGVTGVTALTGTGLYVGGSTVTDTSAVVVTTVSSLRVDKPAAAGLVTIENTYIMDTDVANCFLTAAGVWTGTGFATNGNVQMTAAGDLVILAATAAAWELSDGTTKYYAVDTRVATAGVVTHTWDISDYTIASGAGNVETGWSFAAHTLNYTGNTQVTTQVDTVVIGARTIAADGAGGALTVDESNTLLLVAPTEGANAVLTAASALRIVNAGGTPINQYGIYIEDLTVGATADYGIYIAGADTAAIYVASGDPIHLGVAGASTGKIEMDGATSGTCTIIPLAATTSWTWTLPGVANTNAGYVLMCVGANSVSSWQAEASLRELKDIGKQHSAQDALDKILGTRVYDFRYKTGAGTGDTETEYVGVIADEAPWAMHYGGGVVNPINALGYTVLAFQAMGAEIKALRAEVAALKGAK